MPNDNEIMRGFIRLVDDGASCDNQEMVSSDTIVVDFNPKTHQIIVDLENAVFRMRSFCETSEGDYALGVEMGMQMCADMIDNIIKRYNEGE